MVTVADIVALPAFTHVELIAPCEGSQQREVRNVGILDCPPDYNEYSAYVPGELILTNLGFAYGNPELAERSLLAMLRRDVAAIAVKTVYDPPISDAVRRESAADAFACATFSECGAVDGADVVGIEPLEGTERFALRGDDLRREIVHAFLGKPEAA